MRASWLRSFETATFFPGQPNVYLRPSVSAEWTPGTHTAIDLDRDLTDGGDAGDKP